MASLGVFPPTVRATLVALAVLACLTTGTAVAGEKLVAPAYPGSIRLTPLQIKDNNVNTGSENAVFVTKDPHEKVQAFYVPKYARLPSKDEGYSAGKTHTTFIVHSYAQSLKSIRKRKGDITKADDMGIYLEWRLEETSRKPLPGYFNALEREAKKHPGHDAELAELRNRYAWLSRAYFLDKKNETISQRCRREQKRKADNFRLWKKCLEEAAGFAYLTRIVINTDEDLGKY